MKLGIDTYTLAERYGDFKAIDFIKEAGFDAIDYSFFGRSEYEKIFGDNFRQYAKEIRKYTEDRGLICNQAHAPLGLHFHRNTPDKYEAMFKKVITAIESASIMGAETIVLHSQEIADDIEGDAFRHNVEFFKSLIPYCEEFDINIAIENIARIQPKSGYYCGCFPSNPEEIRLAITEEIKSPRIVSCIDVGHAAILGNPPEKFIERLDGSYLKALHISDSDYVEDRHSLPFIWNINWSKVMKALKKIGYQGDLNLEISPCLKKIPDALMADTLEFAVKIGRHLISEFETN